MSAQRFLNPGRSQVSRRSPMERQLSSITSCSAQSYIQAAQDTTQGEAISEDGVLSGVRHVISVDNRHKFETS